jgi:predicted ATPase/transcriptional regulator with XRE-family HTH domain
VVPFGARLRRLRDAAGLTQEELAAKAGLTARGISDLERGVRKRPYPHTVRSISEALNLPEDERASLLASVPRRSSATAQVTGSGAEPLPVPSTPLVGRERELGEIGGFLARHGARLLTLTGPGGVGKTRLATEVLQEMKGLFPDGVAFVALASLGDPALVVPTSARSLGLREAVGKTTRGVLHAYLREKRYLLVLDNFEHLMGATPEVAALIEHCPNLTVLVTSRAPLRVRGEQEYPVGPLALTTPEGSPVSDEVAGSPAGRLFVERARATVPAFELNRANAGAVAAICRRLDGLPLALELAAARVRFLGPSALLSRLDRALEAGGARDLPPRQRTIRATLDWSYDLLSKAARDLFARLSVFSGGFTLEAAEAVGEGEASGGELDVMVLIEGLVEHSLILAETKDRGVRYRMLEPIRQYALEKLEESDEASEARLRHVRYYLALAEEAEPQIKAYDQVEWLDRLEAENDNLRAAVSWSLETDEARTAARFGWALRMYWLLRARQAEGRMLMEQTLERDSGQLPARTRAQALDALAVCMYGLGDDRRLITVAEEGADLSRRAGDSHGEARGLGMMGFAALQLGELDRAQRVLEEALKGFRKHQDAWTAAHILNHLAVVPLRRGEYRWATGYAEEALDLTRQTGDRLAAQTALQVLAQSAWATGEHEEATRYFRASLVVASELADRVNVAYCLQGLAEADLARGDPHRAARMLGAAESLLEIAATPLYAWADHDMHQRATDTAREALGERAWKEAREEGGAMTFEEAVAYALGEDEASPPHS